MTTTVVAEPAVHWSPRQSRPGRGTLVATDLAALHGPTAGTLELPVWLHWHPNRTFNLDHPRMLAWAYQVVLREAGRPSDLALLDGATLTALWPSLALPAGVRRAWEEHHPALRAAASVAA